MIMLKDSLAHSQDDALRRAIKEAQIEAQRMIEAVQSALKSDTGLLDEAQRTNIKSLITQLQAAALGEDRSAINAAINALDAGTRDFAAHRMNESIRRAFAGQRVDALEAEVGLVQNAQAPKGNTL